MRKATKRNCLSPDLKAKAGLKALRRVETINKFGYAY